MLLGSPPGRLPRGIGPGRRERRVPARGLRCSQAPYTGGKAGRRPDRALPRGRDRAAAVTVVGEAATVCRGVTVVGEAGRRPAPALSHRPSAAEGSYCPPVVVPDPTAVRPLAARKRWMVSKIATVSSRLNPPCPPPGTVWSSFEMPAASSFACSSVACS